MIDATDRKIINLSAGRLSPFATIRSPTPPARLGLKKDQLLNRISEPSGIRCPVPVRSHVQRGSHGWRLLSCVR